MRLNNIYEPPQTNLFISLTILENWKQRVGHKEANKIKTEASSRGTSMHSYIEDFLRGRINESFFESNEQYKNTY